MRLSNKSIVVTGSTTGIGEAIARRCIAEGANVLVHGRDRARGETIVRDLGDRAALHIDDLADVDAASRVAEAALSAFGRIDVVVNNAATSARSNLTTTSAASFDAVFDLNVRAPMLLIQAAIESLKETNGAVLNIGSINAYCGEKELLDYSMSKGALVTMTRNLADALGPDGVRINQINPGWVLTPNEDVLQRRLGQPPDWLARVAPKSRPWGRLIAPEEIAAAAVYWIGDESRPISGTVVDLEQFPVVGRLPSLLESDPS